MSYDQAAEAPVKVRLEDGYRFDTDRGYRVQNLKEKDGGQTGLLILYLYTVPEGKEFVEKDRFDDMELTEMLSSQRTTGMSRPCVAGGEPLRGGRNGGTSHLLIL